MRFLTYLTTLFAFSLLAACGGGGGSAGASTNNPAFFTTAPTSVTVGIGTTQQFSLGGGAGPYSATSSNTAVVGATVSGTNLTVTGVSQGSATITLRDNAGTSQTLAITVAPGTAFFTTAPSALTIPIGGSQQFVVGGGSGPYTAVSANLAVAVPAISGNTLTLGGVAPGVTTINLRDATGASQTLAITVAPSQPLSTTAPATLTIGIGAANTVSYQIRGGVSPYTVSSNNPSVLGATVSGSTLTLTGLAAGSGSAIVSDSTGTSVTVGVTVSASTGPALFTTAPSGGVTVNRGTTPTYSIGGGTAPYSATSSNTGVVTATVSGSTLTLTPVGNGTASVVVRDAANSTSTVAVTVSSAPIALNPSAYTGSVGDVLYSTITGGAGPYVAISGVADAADVDIGTLSGGVFTSNPNGNVLRIKVKQTGASTNIIVTDASGSSATLPLTTAAASSAISLAPSALSISEFYSGPIQLMLYGATGTTNIFSDNTGLVTVTTPVQGSTSGTPVTVRATGVGVCNTGVVTISAVDANGAIAKSLITITKNTAGTPPGC